MHDHRHRQAQTQGLAVRDNVSYRTTWNEALNLTPQVLRVGEGERPASRMGNTSPRASFSKSATQQNCVTPTDQQRTHIAPTASRKPTQLFHAFCLLTNPVQSLPRRCSLKQTDVGALSLHLTHAPVAQSGVTLLAFTPEVEHMRTSLLLLQVID